VVVDGNVITSRGPGTALEFSLAMVEMLYGEDKAKEVAAPMVRRSTHSAPPTRCRARCGLKGSARKTLLQHKKAEGDSTRWTRTRTVVVEGCVIRTCKERRVAERSTAHAAWVAHTAALTPAPCVVVCR